MGQPLAFDAFHDGVNAHLVGEAENGAAEIKLGKVAMQVCFAAMLIDTDHAGLADREYAFGRPMRRSDLRGPR